jgi:enoyl-CoA hydratase/carnithine racemase
VRIKELRHQAAKLGKNTTLGILFRRLSLSRLITIAQIAGRARGAGSEFALACDMRFAATETAVLSQPEQGFGLVPGAGGIQHLARLVGRGRALEIMLSAGDYDAALAERYGWINRAVPAAELDNFVQSLAHRVAKFPLCAQKALKDRVNAITLAPVVDFDCDADIFATATATPETQSRVRSALKRGLQTPQGELALADMLDEF